MTNEEKIKAYDKALERAKSLIGDTIIEESGQHIAEVIFPELKDSENKRIKEDIISYIKVANQIIPQLQIDKWITWLEKQDKVPIAINIDKMVRDYASNKEYSNEEFGRPINCMIRAYRQGLTDAVSTMNLEKQDEQKHLFEFKAKDWYVSKVDGKIHNIKYNPIDKVKPKFKIGDWVVYYRNDSSREVFQVYDIRDGRYYFTDNVHFSWSVKECDEKCHLWTIEDAKEGDILINYEDKCQFIFKGLLDTNHPNCPVAYCGIDDIGEFRVSSGNYWWEDSNVKPATKEQCNLLFQKMKEAGYEWLEETKELKKIEQKPAWSEEDEEMLADAYIMLDWYKGNNWWTAQGIKDWLKELKQRMGG